MSFKSASRRALWAAAGILAIGCTPAGDSPLAPLLGVDGPSLSVVEGPKVVISQVYGGGGNLGSTYTHDFVELYNRGNEAAPLSGLTLQYGSSSGDIGASASNITILNGTIAPGRYYLIQLAKGSGGTTPLPAPDATGTTAAAANAGKFALLTGTVQLGCSSGTKPCNDAQRARILDLVGFGSANFFEGSDGTPAASNTKAVLRKANGAQDTDDNLADFVAGDPAPRNSAFGGVDIGPLESLTLAGASSLKPGFTATVTAVAADAEGDAIADGAVTWSIDGTSVELASSTDRTATVRALALGQATVRASITQGETTRSASWTIEVIEAGDPARISVDFPPGSLPPGFDYFGYPKVFDADGAEIRGPAARLTATTTTPHILSIDPETNIVTTRAEGRGFVTLTAPNGYAYTFYVDVNDGAGSGVSYQNHLDFGTPTDGTPDDDVVATFPEYVASYNAARGQPNWVAYNLEATHRGASDRCDCFTGAPIAAIPRLTTFDYIGSGYSRGHMVMSEDRTAGGSGSRVSIDNARTFYFTNIIPQTSQNNGGPWLKLETHLGNLATNQDKEIFILAGGAQYEGTLNSAGKIAIPTVTWKIAVVMPRNAGLANVDGVNDFELIAVAMPNVTSMPSPDWTYYQVSVDEVERLTGYDFLALLPDYIERIVESGDRAPSARIVANGGVEGEILTFDGSTSSDPDVGTPLNDALSYEWTVNGHTTGTASTVTGTFPDNGTVSVRLVVTDRFGWADTASTTVAITNVAPTLASLDGAVLLEGERYAAGSTFTDPGTADSWTATVNYGDGSPTRSLSLADGAFTLSHPFTTAGTFTVTVTITDDDGGVGSRTATVTVHSALQGVANLLPIVDALRSDSDLNPGEVQSLRAKLNAAAGSLRRGNATAATGQLGAFINELEAMESSGRVSQSVADSIIAYAQRVIRSIRS